MAKVNKTVGPSDPPDDWDAWDDFHTLKRAAEVIADKKRYDQALKAGEKEMKETQKSLTTVRGLRR